MEEGAADRSIRTWRFSLCETIVVECTYNTINTYFIFSCVEVKATVRKEEKMHEFLIDGHQFFVCSGHWGVRVRGFTSGGQAIERWT